MRSISRFAAVGAAGVLLATACSGGASPPPGTGGSTTAGASRTPATPVTRPASVPPDAAYVDLDRSFGGSIVAPATAPPPLLSSLSCTNDVLTIVLTRIVELYAALPCDRAAPGTVADLFIGHPVTIDIQVANPEKLRLGSPAAGTLEFTISGAWAVEQAAAP